ncbi:hypothetical protein [Coprococcus eutactus]|uniref:hypothetical protein n=1 Tax=Coprococcus eutactus TaxID=33043 RepID=UPI002EBD3AC6|nr:hypothetical protein [Coprococcus eutactus]
MEISSLKIFSDMPPITDKYLKSAEFQNAMSSVFCTENMKVYGSVDDKKGIALQLRYLGFIVSLMNSFVEKDVTEELAALRSVNSFTEISTDCILQFKDVTENFCIFRKNGNDLLVTLYVFCNTYEFIGRTGEFVLFDSYETRGYSGNLYGLLSRLSYLASRVESTVGMGLF